MTSAAMTFVPSPVTAPPAGPGLVGVTYDRWDEDSTPRSLVCRDVIEHNQYIRSFVFSAEGRVALPHVAGQYVTISVEIDGQTVSRCYTVSSPPTRPYMVRITVKREPLGVVSNWLHDHLAVGDTVQISGPAGTFCPTFHDSDRLLLLAGGVGVTPMLSMMSTFVDLAEDVDAVLLHHSREPEHVVMADELAAVCAGHRGLRVVQAVDQDPDGSWEGSVGRLDEAMLAEHVSDLLERDVFLCGPAPYMDGVTALLTSLGVQPERIHRESFVLPVLEEVPPLVEPSGETHTVTFAKSGKTVDIEAGQTVLDAAKQAGVRIPTSCTQGLCGTCKLSKLGGELTIDHQGGIRPREIERGKFLACCSRPTTAVEVDL